LVATDAIAIAIAIAITAAWMLNLRRQTFWKLIVYAKLPAQLKEKNDA